MVQLIDKSALLAEIEKRQKEEVFYDEDGSFASWADQNHHSTLESIKNFINTLEVKEVDLDEKIKDYIYTIPHAKTGIPNGWKLSWAEEDVIEIAKHFFELGLKVQKGK